MSSKFLPKLQHLIRIWRAEFSVGLFCGRLPPIFSHNICPFRLCSLHSIYWARGTVGLSEGRFQLLIQCFHTVRMLNLILIKDIIMKMLKQNKNPAPIKCQTTTTKKKISKATLVYISYVYVRRG